MQTFSAGLSTPNIDGVVYMDGMTYPLTDAGFSAAVAALPTNGTLRITSGKMVSLTTAHNITTQISIVCDPGAGFSYPAASGAYIELSGVSSTMTGCALKGQGSSTAQQAILINANLVSFTRNTVSGFGSSSSNGTLEVLSGNAVEIKDNVFLNNVDFDIFVNNSTASQEITGLIVSGNTAGEIILHSSVSGAQILHFTVEDNILTAGYNSKVEFCVEVQSYGGAYDNSWGVVSGNVCELAAGSVDGGYSVGGTQISVTGNIFNSNGKTFTVSALEIVLCSDCLASSNILNDGVGGDGISVDRSSGGQITNNSVIGFATGSNDYGIHVVVASTTVPAAINNEVSGNLIAFPTGGTGIGIWQQCNAVGANCSNNKYSGNSLFSDGTSGSRGIDFENDTGTSANEVLGSNQFNNPATPVVRGSGVTFASDYQKIVGSTYATTSNCSSSAAPAVCGSAAAGSVVLPTGAAPTTVVDTTAVTANSQIFLNVDDSLGSQLSVTCNTTTAQVGNPAFVTARTAGTSFTIQTSSTVGTNPICVSYLIVN